MEIRNIKDLCNIKRGIVISKKDIENNEGIYPVYSSQTENNGELGKIDTYMYDGEYVTWTTDGAYAGTVFHRTGKFNITNICGILDPKEKNILIPKYLYYILSIVLKEYVNPAGGNPKLMSNVMGEVEIPLPNLQTQQKIVSQLDPFLELIEKLKEELRLRKIQYEYYRDKMFEFDDVEDIEYVKIENIFNMKMGYTPSKKNTEYWENGTIPWFRVEDIRKSGRVLTEAIQNINEKGVKGKLFKKNSLIISTSATVGEYALLKVDCLTNQRFINLEIKEEYRDILPEYLLSYFYKISELCIKNSRKGSFLSVDMEMFREFEIPLPDINTQHHIASTLDTFTSLITKISSEISMREKQYSYYRSLLFNRLDEKYKEEKC